MRIIALSLFLISSIFSATTLAQNYLPKRASVVVIEDPSTSEINSILSEIRPNLSEREAFSAITKYFVGKPYLLGPLGEGENGEFDQDPLFRTDAFDCTTFIETVIALTKSHHIEEFKETLKRIRYLDGDIKYQSRNHFIEIDWIPNNQTQGFIKDISKTLGEFNEATTLHIERMISKKNWYLSKTPEELQVPGLNPEKKHQRLTTFRNLGENISDQKSSIDVIPTETLKELAKEGLIPEPAILNWVRDIAGTQMVTHQLLLLKTNGEYILRHASSKRAQVFEIPLLEYLEGIPQNTIGFNVNLINFQ